MVDPTLENHQEFDVYRMVDPTLASMKSKLINLQYQDYFSKDPTRSKNH